MVHYFELSPYSKSNYDPVSIFTGSFSYLESFIGLNLSVDSSTIVTRYLLDNSVFLVLKLGTPWVS